MPVSLGDAYRGAFSRIDAHARHLAATDPGSLDAAVPACPGWRVRDVVAHLAGIATDALAGSLSGPPDDEWTARQVQDRDGRPVEDVLDEWAPNVEKIAGLLDARKIGVPPVVDALTHEGDIAEALGDPVPPAEGWLGAAALVCRGTVRGIDAPGTLTVRCGEGEWAGGSGGDGPAATLEIEPWEFFRGVASRRSAEQMRAWSWDGDPEPWLAPLTMFGLREDDQPRCA